MALQALALVQNKQYAVVKFQTEKAIEIIATKWLIADETTLKAFWPPGPYFNARQLVPKQPDPGSDWECFNVIVMQATSKFFFTFSLQIYFYFVLLLPHYKSTFTLFTTKTNLLLLSY